MKRIHIIIALVVLIIGALVFIFLQNNNQTPVVQVPQEPSSFDVRNSSFTVENAPVTLVNGLAEVSLASIPDAKITTKYFGNEATGDLNFDGLNDVAFLITQDGGGSGLFYYVVVALKTEEGYQTTNAFFIGDRIAPQSTEIKSGELHVNFAERREGEPMTAVPSQGAVLLLKVTSEGVLEGLMK